MTQAPPRVLIAIPVAASARTGNRATARRWQQQLQALGCPARIVTAPTTGCADWLIALHAGKSAEVVQQFRARCQGRIAVVLTGTDIYGDGAPDARALASLQAADVIVALQPDMRTRLPAPLAARAQVILQGCALAPQARPQRRYLDVLVSGHLRPEKDPFRAVEALHQLPPSVPIRLTQLGGELSPGLARQAQHWMRREPRYRYRGEWSPARARTRLARADLLINASRTEGAPAVVIEAIVAQVPVLASAIPGHQTLLGDDYRGYFPVGDTAALAQSLQQCVSEPARLADLRAQLQLQAPRFSLAREQAALAALLGVSISKR